MASKLSPPPVSWATSPTDPRVLGVFFAIGAGCLIGPFLAVVFIPTDGTYSFPWGQVGLLLVVANILGAAALMGRLRASYVLIGLFRPGSAPSPLTCSPRGSSALSWATRTSERLQATTAATS